MEILLKKAFLKVKNSEPFITLKMRNLRRNNQKKEGKQEEHKHKWKWEMIIRAQIMHSITTCQIPRLCSTRGSTVFSSHENCRFVLKILKSLLAQRRPGFHLIFQCNSFTYESNKLRSHYFMKIFLCYSFLSSHLDFEVMFFFN